MASAQRAWALREIGTLFAEGIIAALPDDRLLERFASQRDQAAFTALVERHGPMVLRVCRQVLNDGHHAEDAFQATFLILARKAGSVRRRDSVAPWLYRIASRVARKARAGSARQRERERQGALLREAATRAAIHDAADRHDALATLHDEIGKLPEVYRELVVLCYLEGQTCEQAARQLRRPLGTVTVQLARARDRLRARLTRRGLAMAAGWLVAEEVGKASAAILPQGLIGTTTTAACRFAAGGSAASTAVPPLAAALTEGVLKAMLATKLKSALILGLVLVAAWVLGPSAHLSGGADEPAHPSPGRLGESWVRPAILCVAYAPDGKALAAGGFDGTIRLCDSGTAADTLRFKGHAGAVQALAYAPDGKVLASAGRDGTMILWDAEGHHLRRLAGPGPAVLGLSFSPDGTRLASGGLDGSVRLWEPAAGKEVNVLRGHEGGVHAIAFAPDGKLVASGGEDGTVRLWNPSDGNEVRSINTGNGVRTVAFAPDCKTLASGGLDGIVRIWNTATAEEVRQVPFYGVVHCVTFAPDGKTAAVTDYASVSMFNPEDGSPLFGGGTYVGYHGYVASVQSLRFSPDGKTLAYGTADGTIHLRDTTANQDRATIDPPARNLKPETGHEDYVESLAFSPNGKILASGSYDRTIKLWDPGSGKTIRTLEGHEVGYLGHEGTVRSLSFAPDGKRLASACEDQTVRVWDVTSGAEMLKLGGNQGYVGSVAYSPDGKRLASACDSGQVRLFDADSGQELLSIQVCEGWALAVVFAPDGKTLVSTGADKKVKIWDAGNGQWIRELEGHISFPDAVAYSPDGKTIASGSWDGTVRLWDPATGTGLFVLKGHEERVHGIAFAPNSKILASAGEDGTVRLWDVASGKPVLVLKNPVSWVFPVAFAPDGKTLAAGSGSAVRLWDVDAQTR